MFEKIRKLKDRKGFTLVELIVVLVILAILAALLIPALTGYIDKAKVTAPDNFTEKVTVDGKETTHGAVVRSLAEVSGHWTATVDASGKVTKLIYENASWHVEYTASETATADGATTTTAAHYSDPTKLTGEALKTDTYNPAD